MNPESSYRLKVPRAGLEEAFGLVRKLCKPKRDEEAVLSFDGACLHIECAGMTVAPGAEGCWPSQVRIPATYLLMLAKVPPTGDLVDFIVRESRLHVGTSSVGCAIQPAWSKSIELPMNATFGQVLALYFLHSPEEIEAAGCGKMVANAKAWADRRIEKTAEQLSDLLIEPEDLRKFVYETMKRKISEGELPR